MRKGTVKMAIITWEQYSSLYSKVNEDEFDKAEELAEREVKLVIGPIRWANINAETFGYEVLQDCICKVIDQMQTDLKRMETLGVSSVSNDGYSETYGSNGTAQTLRDELRQGIRSWLSGTGLVGAY